MRKVGYFFFGFTPFLLGEAIQFLSLAFMYGISALCGGAMGELNFSSSNAGLLKVWSDNNFNTLLMINYAVISICAFGMWYYGKCDGDFKPDVHRTFNAPLIISIIVLVPGAQFCANYICALIQYVAPSIWDNYEKLVETSGLGSINALMVVYSVLLAPICEELIFRGVTLKLFKVSVPFWFANIMQAFLFGLFHLNWVQGCYAFVLGLLLGFVCEKGRSIYYSIGLHILFNFWGTFISSLLAKIDNPIILGLMIILITILSLVIGLVLFFIGCRMRENKIKNLDSMESDYNMATM